MLWTNAKGKTALQKFSNFISSFQGSTPASFLSQRLEVWNARLQMHEHREPFARNTTRIFIHEVTFAQSLFHKHLSSLQQQRNSPANSSVMALQLSQVFSHLRASRPLCCLHTSRSHFQPSRILSALLTLVSLAPWGLGRKRWLTWSR